MDPPERLRLLRHREVRWMLFPAASVAVIAVAAWIASVVFGDDGAGASEAADWTGPLLGVGGLVGVAFAGWAVSHVVLRRNERRHAEAVLADAIAVWPQYATAGQWGKVIEEAEGDTRASVVEILVPGAIITVVVGTIAGFGVAAGEPGAVFVLGAFWLLVVGLVVGRQVVGGRDRQADLRHRCAIADLPRCWVSETGAYDEDSGLVMFDQAAAVEFVDAGRSTDHRQAVRSAARGMGEETDLTALDGRLARSGWSLLAVTLDSTVARTLWRKVEVLLRSSTDRTFEWRATVHVRVPPGHESEARTVAERIRRRWSVRAESEAAPTPRQ